jgi:hypothetical protein
MMTGICSGALGGECGAKTATMTGSEENHPREGRKGLLRAVAAVNGYRLGYVKENTDPPRLICAVCLVNSLPSNIAA